MNRRTDGTPSDVAVTLRELGLQSPTGYRVEVREIQCRWNLNINASVFLILGLVRRRRLRHIITKHQNQGEG